MLPAESLGSIQAISLTQVTANASIWQLVLQYISHNPVATDLQRAKNATALIGALRDLWHENANEACLTSVCLLLVHSPTEPHYYTEYPSSRACECGNISDGSWRYIGTIKVISGVHEDVTQ